MTNYMNNGGKLELIIENPFRLERDIQELTEKNLNTVFDLDYIRSEFSLNGFRIDTLAYDHNNDAFVIIEYKREQKFSVIDQGYAYLALMLNNKADFILEYNEHKQNILKKNDVNWSQSRIIFISPSFTSYQKEAINFKDLPFELWEIKRYENNIINFSQVQTNSNVQETIKTISVNDSDIKIVNSEITMYTEEEHFKNIPYETLELYETFKDIIKNIGDIKIKPTKLYISFTNGSPIVDICIQRKSIKMFFNLCNGELDDPKQLTRDVSNIGHWGNGDYELIIRDYENVDYIISLIKQSYQKNSR